jgi:hypothetical protein
VTNTADTPLDPGERRRSLELLPELAPEPSMTEMRRLIEDLDPTEIQRRLEILRRGLDDDGMHVRVNTVSLAQLLIERLTGVPAPKRPRD